MSNDKAPKLGRIVWQDLTVPDADGVRDFYRGVVGWDTNAHDMGDYSDYEMLANGTGDCVAGICHARGPNAKMPAQWLIYVTVADVEASAARCVELGGALVDGPRPMEGKPFCVVRDPAGAVLALIQA